MKYRIKQHLGNNILEEVKFNTTCSISYTTDSNDNSSSGPQFGTFINGNDNHVINVAKPLNTLLTIKTEYDDTDNSAAGKVFGVIASRDTTINTSTLTSYSEDYGTLYYLGEKYNDLKTKVKEIYNQSAKKYNLSSTNIWEDIPSNGGDN